MDQTFTVDIFKMTIWPPSDEMMHARLWDFIILHPSQETICWCGSGCLSLACSGRACFYGNPGHCHKADLDHYTHLSADQRCSPQFQWKFWWYESAPLPRQSPLEWQTVFVLFSAPLFQGCLCLADVDKCLGLACLCRILRIGAEVAACPPMTLSANFRKLQVPGEIFKAEMWAHLPVSSLFCFDPFREKNLNLQY